MMAQLYIFDIIGRGALTRGDLHHLVYGHEEELGLWVDEFLDQPGTSDAIHFDLLASDPFHADMLLVACLPVASSATMHRGPDRSAGPATGPHDRRPRRIGQKHGESLAGRLEGGGVCPSLGL